MVRIGGARYVEFIFIQQHVVVVLIDCEVDNFIVYTVAVPVVIDVAQQEGLENEV